MRRSSWIVLLAAAGLLVVALILYAQSNSAAARRMDSAGAARFIADGKAALERRDINAILSIMYPKAVVLGHNLDELRSLVQSAVEQVHGKLTFETRNVRATQTGSTAEMSFDIDIAQKSANMDAL